jgi:hypothetical protein
MDSLPRELLESILMFNVQMCRCNKNNIFPLRLVCKAFDAFLKPYIFKTIQLEFSKFLRYAATPELKSLETVGKLCQAVYLDMMVVRDEGMCISPIQAGVEHFVEKECCHRNPLPLPTTSFWEF